MANLTNQSKDPNNPWNPSPAAPPASGMPADYTNTAGLRHVIGRPHTNESLEGRNQPEEDIEAQEPTQVEPAAWGTPSRRNYGMATQATSQGLTPPELQGGQTFGGIRGQRLVYMEEQRPEGEEELAESSIKADPREEVRVYPGQTDAPNQPSDKGIEESRETRQETTREGTTPAGGEQPLDDGTQTATAAQTGPQTEEEEEVEE